ncbi:MAG: TPM domain-containing protein [Nitrospirae bacterium]|nr:MAG: TPM domain-containing protein [Nitrospirota bacterium]
MTATAAERAAGRARRTNRPVAGRRVLSAAVGIVVGWVLAALVPLASALDVPSLSGRLVDAAHLLPPDLTATLSAELAAHEERTGNQVVLLTLPSLGGEPVEEFAHRVATTWQLGRKGIDNGVLLLVVPGDRRVRIEVGYGLEGTLTDAKASRIIRQEIIPRFRSGDVAGGVAAGLRAIMGTIEGTYVPAERTSPPATETNGPWNLLFIAVVVGVMIGAAIGARRGAGGFTGSLVSFFLALSAGWIFALAAAILVMIVILALSGLSAGGGRTPYGGWGGAGGLGGGDFGGFSGAGSFGGGGGGFGGGGASGQW